jgi:hypothetical protein
LIPDFAEIYGIETTPELALELRAAQPSGIHLLRRNIESADQVRELVEALARELGGGLEFSVRHEGGAVTPFVRGVTSFPGLEALEAAANPVLARDVGRAMGNELAAMGITMNLLPETGPMACEMAVGLRCVGIKVGVGPVVPGASKEADEGEGAALAAAVAGAALRVERDPGKLLPLPPGCRVGLLVPRLGDVADRLPIGDELRGTAALLRPAVGASVAVLEVPVQPDDRTVAMAAEWMAAQEAGVFLCFDARRFEGQRRLLEALSARSERLVVATIGNSADRGLVGEGAALVRTCGFQACQLRAALAAMFYPAGPEARPRETLRRGTP